MPGIGVPNTAGPVPPPSFPILKGTYPIAPVFLTGGLGAYALTVKQFAQYFYLTLDDATTGLTDQSGNARNGTASGGIGIGGFAESPIRSEVASTQLDGVDDRITTTYNPFTNGTIRTFAGWAYRDNNSAFHALWGVVTHTGTQPNMYLETGSGDVHFLPANSTVVTWAAAWPGNSQWVHWLMTFNESADTAELYINGVSQGVQAATDAYNASPGNLAIGVQGDTFSPWKGRQAHFVVLERAPTAAEIATLASPAPPLIATGQSSATLALTAPAVFGTRKNLVTNPSFEVDTTGWTQNGATGTLTRVTTDLVFGSACAQQVNPGTNLYEGIVTSGTLTSEVGATFTAAAYVKSTAGTFLTIQVQDSSVSAATHFQATGGWDRVQVTLTTTVGFLNVAIFNDSDGGRGAFASTFYVDGVQVIKESSAGDYFDGSFSGASWEGTANASISDTGVLRTSGQSSATLSLTAKTAIPLGTASATSSATLVFKPYFTISAAGQSSATLALTAPTFLTGPRRNFITNPKAGAGTTTGWSNNGLDSLTAVTLGSGGAPAASAAMSDIGLATGFHCVSTANGGATYANRAVAEYPANTGDYAVQWYAYLVTLGGATRVRFGLADLVNEDGYVDLTTTGSWTALPFTKSFTLLESNLSAYTYQDGAGAAEWYFTGVILEQGTTTGSYIEGAPLLSNGASTATLALNAPTIVALGTSAGLSTSSLALSAKTTVALDTSAATSSATLALSAPTAVALGTSAATSTATLALTAQTQIPLGSADGVSSATLALNAPTTVALGTSAAISTSSLALTAPAQVVLGTSDAQSSATLALSATTSIPLTASAAQSTATLALTAATTIPLGTSAALSTATLSVSAATTIPLGTSAAVSTTALTLTALTLIPLGTSAALSTATLALTAETQVPLGASNAISTATLSLSAKTTIPLDASNALSTGSLALSARALVSLDPSVATSTATASITTAGGQIPFDESSGQSTATLALTIPARIALGTSSALSSTTLALTAPAIVLLGGSSGQSSAALSITAPTGIPLGASNGVATATLALRAKTRIPLSAAAGQSNTGILYLSARTQIRHLRSHAVSSGTLAVSASTTIHCRKATIRSSASLVIQALPFRLNPSAAVSTASLSLRVMATVHLAPVVARSSASAIISAPVQIPLGTSAGSSAGTLVLSFAVEVPLGASHGQSAATLVFITLVGPTVPHLVIMVVPQIMVLQLGDASLSIETERVRRSILRSRFTAIRRSRRKHLECGTQRVQAVRDTNEVREALRLLIQDRDSARSLEEQDIDLAIS